MGGLARLLRANAVEHFILRRRVLFLKSCAEKSDCYAEVLGVKLVIMERLGTGGMKNMDLGFLLWWFLGGGEELYMNSFGSSIYRYELADDEVKAK